MLGNYQARCLSLHCLGLIILLQVNQGCQHLMLIYFSLQEELCIGPTAYGTRWYLTLFNYTIPFPAQLRVWDVFMLLGDDTSSSLANPTSSPNATSPNSKPSISPNPEFHFGTTLDVLHASSAALIDGMRDILLESDFENGMKVLTSWIPIQDEDLFMRIARAEWKMHAKLKRGG